MAYPSEQAAAEAAGVPPRLPEPRLATLQSISVYVHEDGSVRVFHSRLDMAQYKVISHRLADQVCGSINAVEVALCLIAAACEVYEDAAPQTEYRP